MFTYVCSGTASWGVKVERVEIKNLALPQELTRSMAAEAEAARTARAQLIYSEAEKQVCPRTLKVPHQIRQCFQAGNALRQAAKTMAENPLIMRLRMMQVKFKKEIFLTRKNRCRVQNK